MDDGAGDARGEFEVITFAPLDKHARELVPPRVRSS